MTATATATHKIESLIRIASRLIGVLEREVALLRAMQVADLPALQGEKGELTVAYEEAVRAVAADPRALEAVAPALRETLAETAVRFDGALAENARALEAVRDSHDRMLRAIVDAVADKRSRERAYDANGSFDTRRRSPRAPALSLALDQRL